MNRLQKIWMVEARRYDRGHPIEKHDYFTDEETAIKMAEEYEKTGWYTYLWQQLNYK